MAIKQGRGPQQKPAPPRCCQPSLTKNVNATKIGKNGNKSPTTRHLNSQYVSCCTLTIKHLSIPLSVSSSHPGERVSKAALDSSTVATKHVYTQHNLQKLPFLGREYQRVFLSLPFSAPGGPAPHCPPSAWRHLTSGLSVHTHGPTPVCTDPN